MCFNNGKIFIVSAPSGAGKTTLCKIACERIPQLVYSVSYTTRLPRKGEVDGVDYYFVSEKEFSFGIHRGHWLEWAKVHGNFYGTSLSFLRENIAAGSDVLLDIDVHGTETILEKYNDVVTIFVTPPSLKVLEERLHCRGTDSVTVIKERLRKAKLEMKKKDLYQYIIVNDDLKKAVDSFVAIFQQYT